MILKNLFKKKDNLTEKDKILIDNFEKGKILHINDGIDNKELFYEIENENNTRC